MDLFLIVIAASIWLACMSLAIVLPIKPSIVKITEKLVCPPGTTMEVRIEVYSYHRSRQRAINIIYTDENGAEHTINGRAIFALLGIFFIIALPIVTAAALIIRGLVQTM